MTIKQSTLEAKVYYRVLKTILLALPLLLVLFWVLARRTIICTVTFGGLPDLTTLVLIALGVILYFVLLRALWRTALYIIFGGLENDTRGAQAPAGSPGSKKFAWIVLIVAIFIVALIIATQQGYITLPKQLSNIPGLKHAPAPACPSTSAQTSTPCGSVRGGVGVSGIIVRGACSCPSDTTFAGMDNVTPGGPYKMCTCR